MAITRVHSSPTVLKAMGCTDPTGVLVSCCCPGACVSDMSSLIASNNDNRFMKTAAQGADTVNWLALLPERDAMRGFFARPRQYMMDKELSADWLEWTCWSEANNGEVSLPPQSITIADLLSYVRLYTFHRHTVLPRCREGGDQGWRG
jgi:hypothetical protein